MKTVSFAVVMFLAGGIGISVSAQDGEIYVPGLSDDEETQATETVVQPVQSSLAACLANPTAGTCKSAALGAGDGLESTAVLGDEIQLETFVLNLDDGSVQSHPVVADDYTDNYVAAPSVAIAIEFDSNKSDIRYDQFTKLHALQAALADPLNLAASFAIIGHTDAVGSASYNCTLSDARAQSVVYALSDSIDVTRLLPVGAGEFLLKNLYDTGSQDNRRVTFLKLDTTGLQLFTATSRLCSAY